ncbi:MAG: MFS transporter [Bryobacteraceae bacterium]|nr:MFS transporter [Bryobacteraceae bacterium]
MPDSIRAVVDALHFRAPRRERLAALSPAEWAEALAFCDRTQLTLVLLLRCEGHLPPEIKSRIEANLAANQLRFGRLLETYGEAGSALRRAQIPYVVLKGFSQSPWFGGDAAARIQYDLDLLCPPDDIWRARDCMLELGYQPVRGSERFPTDHLPVMVRKTGYEWNGDYFDPRIPVSIDLHFRLWDRQTERFEPGGVGSFWGRRVLDRLECGEFPALHPADRLGYACLHLLRHLLRGSLRPYHVYEIAWLLEHREGDTRFWTEWRELHGADLRRVEAICFALCEKWFGCRMAEAAGEEVSALPRDCRAWLDEYGDAPLEGLFVPNKHELWLHLGLVGSGRDRAAVVLRRLLPVKFPGHVDSVLVPEQQLTVWLRIRRQWRYWRFVLGRMVHHGRALPSVLAHGTAWLAHRAGLDRRFFRFLSAAWLYELGMFVFVLLYNLHLIDLGYREDFLGQVTSAQTVGSLAGALPAGVLVQRAGIGRMLSVAFVLLGSLFALRTVVTGRVTLLALAFAGGMVFSAFMVAFAPAIARMTRPESRPLGYGIFFSSGIALGIVGGVLGGRLPGWMSGVGLQGTQAALLASCALIALAAWPVSSLRLPPVDQPAQKLYPRNPILWRLLAVIAVWNLATGSFNPFFNAFFADHMGTGVERLGTIFSISQLAQVAAMLSAPWVLRRFGLVGGIVCMQVATGVALAGLAAGPGASAAAAIYVGYMAFQWMSEPGIYSALMNPLKPAEMGGAAALNMVVTLAAQAIAASVAGVVITRLGYPALLMPAGAVAVLAGLLFWFLLRKTASSISAST